jgi:hypothetical protein
MTQDESEGGTGRELEEHTFAPEGTDLAFTMTFEEKDVVLAISKAGFVIHRFVLEDVQKDVALDDLAKLAAMPTNEFYSLDTQLRILRRVERERQLR